jgi:hypothetical protein
MITQITTETFEITIPIIRFTDKPDSDSIGFCEESGAVSMNLKVIEKGNDLSSGGVIKSDTEKGGSNSSKRAELFKSSVTVKSVDDLKGEE